MGYNSHRQTNGITSLVRLYDYEREQGKPLLCWMVPAPLINTPAPPNLRLPSVICAGQRHIVLQVVQNVSQLHDEGGLGRPGIRDRPFPEMTDPAARASEKTDLAKVACS